MIARSPTGRGPRHQTGGRSVLALLVALLASNAVACSDDAAEPQSALVASMWAQDDPVVDATSPDELYLPGPNLPGGVVLSDVARPDDPPPPGAGPGPLDPTGAAQTLYADPDAPSPELGPALLVGRTQTSDIEGTLVLVEGDVGGGAVAGEPVDVGHDDARRLDVDGLMVIRWPLPVDCACDQEGFVAARGLDAEVVLAAARVADVGASRPSLTEDARAGLRSLGTVASEVRDFPGWSAFPERLTLRHGDGEVELRVHRGDPRMVAHVRFWSPDGPLPSPFPALHRATVLADGTIVHASATGDDVAAVEPIIDATMDSLVPATDEEFDAAQAHILGSVPLPPCEAVAGAPGELDQTDLHGTAGDARWVVGVAVRDGSLWTCETVAPVGVPALGGGGAGPDRSADARPTDPVEVVSNGTTGTGGGSTYRVVIGHAPAPVAAVEVTFEGLDAVNAAIAEEGPAPGRRLFAAVVDVTARGLRPTAGTVVARDAQGTEVGRVPLVGAP